MSAVAWFFGAELTLALERPIGLIEVAAGGTPTEAWVDPQALAADPTTASLVAEGNWLDNPLLGEWCRGRARQNLSQAIDEGWEIPGNDLGPHHAFQPGHMWQTAVEPFTQLPIRGVIWYQGESNAFFGREYRDLFRTLIEDWRAAWGAPALPFLFVQLPGYRVPNPETWAELREAQAMALALPHTEMAVAIDLGQPRDIHPLNKREVGRRLALCALATVYGQDQLVYSGPRFDRVEQQDDRLVVHWTHVGAGLVIGDGKELRGFEIATEDGPFVAATARIDGDTVVLQADGVTAPVHVRYAWTDFPDGNLRNYDRLPASPFRTDDRPRATLVPGEDDGEGR